MKKLFLFILLFYMLPVSAKHMFREEVYQAYWCGKNNGIMEYKLDDNTRVDCLTERYAVEVDFANKWAECIGQAIHYGHKTHKQAACLLILENPEKDLKYLKRLRYNAYKKDIRLKTFTITPDKIHNFMIQEVAAEMELN